MDVVTIASSVISILLPYLSKAAGKFVETAGGAAWDKTAELYQLLKARLVRAPAANQALTEMEAAPNDAAKQAAFNNQLKQLIANDPDFLKQLTSCIDAVSNASGAVTFNNQFSGEVAKVVQVGSANNIQIS